MNQMPGMPALPGAAAAPMAAPPAVAAVPAQAPPMAVPPPAGGPPVQQVFDLDMAAIHSQAEEVSALAQSRKRTSDFNSFKTGINYIRILPPWSQEVASRGQFAKYHMTHFNILEKQTSSCWESSLLNFGFRCPICHIRATYGRYMGDALAESEPRGYHNANAVVYDSPDGGGTFMYKRLKPYVQRLPVTVWTGLMQMMQQPYIGNITSVENGWIIAVNKPESFKGKNTYTWQHVVQGPLAADETTKQAIMADIHDLDRFGDFGIPTVEKLQAQFQLAESLLKSCVQATRWQPEQVPGFGTLELVIPDIVYQTHGQQATVVGMPGSAAPVAAPMAAAPMAAPAGMPVAGIAAPVAVPAPQPTAAPLAAPAAAPVAAPMATAPMAAPAVAPMATAPAMAGPPSGGFPGMPGSVVGTPLGTPPAPAAPAPMPAAPVAAPAVPMVAAPAAPAVAPAPAPMPAVGPAPMPGAPMPGAPMAAAPAPAPAAAMPPAPMPTMPGAPGGTTPPPFPPAPAPQQEVSPSSGVGEAEEKKKKTNNKVKCPGCGKDYSGKRGLTIHMKSSEACKKAAAEAPPAMSEVAPAPAAPAPTGMAPPAFPGGETGPLPPT